MSLDAFQKNCEEARKSPFWIKMKNPNDGRIPMVQFETMRPSLKEKINQHYGGDVYAHYASIPIKNLLLPDAKAEDFYRTYRYDGNKELPPDYQLKCATACKYLNLCVRAVDEKGFIKEELGIKEVDRFWKLIIGLIQSNDIYLPASYGNLVAKPDSAIKRYRNEGYASIISKHFGNKKAAKIGKTEEGFSAEVELQQLVVLKKAAKLHMNLDPTQIADLINPIYKKNGWHQISPATVANKIAAHMPQLANGRKGNKWYNNNVAMQVKREAPQYPSYFWTLDGWTVELAYQDGKRFDNRLVMVVVLDACNKYPVGYAIGERENTDLIRLALRNAIIHMQDLYGATYRPWQIQSDRYGIKNLTPFYEACGKVFTPAAVGNAKSKIIEPYFKYLNKKYCQLQYNWTGFNITASKDNQPNIERLNQIKQSIPTKEGVINQINRFMHKERMSKLEDYRTRWETMPAEHQVTLTPMQCIEVFGQAHNELNSITGQGLTATLNGQELTYDSFEPAFRALQYTTRFKIMYEPANLNEVVAVTEDGKQKFLLHNKQTVGMGFMNTTPAQLEYRKQIKDFNADRKEEIIQTYISEEAMMAEILDSTPFNLANEDEAALKLMFTDAHGQQKELLQDAKRLRKVQKQIQQQEQKQIAQEQTNHSAAHLEYLSSKTDFSQYTYN
jgi:hypothetical protein